MSVEGRGGKERNIVKKLKYEEDVVNGYSIQEESRTRGEPCRAVNQ